MDMLGKFLDGCLKERHEDNFTDRLNYKHTAWLLLGFAVLLGGGHFFIGKPIQCWVPAQFTGGWEQYVNDYCYVENTYYLPFNSSIPDSYRERDSRMLNYYQWVPFVLALMALMFQFPHFVFRMLYWLSGINLRAMIGMSAGENILDIHVPQASLIKLQDTYMELYGKLQEQGGTDDELRNIKNVEDEIKGIKGDLGKGPLDCVADHLHQGLKIETKVSLNSNPLGWIFRLLFLSHGCYVSVLYILLKWAHWGNLILQFYILQGFLGTSGVFWGMDLIVDLANENTWPATGLFPRVTLCDFMIRQLGNTHRWTVQCVLMINMFNEKVFLFLWFWFCILFVVTSYDLLMWMKFVIFERFRLDFVQRLLDACEASPLPPMDVQMFVTNFLKVDGCTALKLIEANSSDTVASMVAGKVWQLWIDDREKEQMARDKQNNYMRPQWMPPNYAEADTMPMHKTERPAFV